MHDNVDSGSLVPVWDGNLGVTGASLGRYWSGNGEGGGSGVREGKSPMVGV